MTNQTSIKEGREQFRYWKTIEVRWGDMDAQGHVNNAVYFTYCESARVELLRKIGYPGKQAGVTEGPALVHAACDYKRQVVYPATLDIGLRVERIGERSFKIAYGIFFQGSQELAAAGISVNAWMDYVAGNSVPLPAEIRSALAEYQ